MDHLPVGGRGMDEIYCSSGYWCFERIRLSLALSPDVCDVCVQLGPNVFEKIFAKEIF